MKVNKYRIGYDAQAIHDRNIKIKLYPFQQFVIRTPLQIRTSFNLGCVTNFTILGLHFEKKKMAEPITLVKTIVETWKSGVFAYCVKLKVTD